MREDFIFDIDISIILISHYQFHHHHIWCHHLISAITQLSKALSMYAKHKLVGGFLHVDRKVASIAKRRFIFYINISLLFIVRYQFHHHQIWCHHRHLSQFHNCQKHWVSHFLVLQHSCRVCRYKYLAAPKVEFQLLSTSFFTHHPDVRHLCYLCYHPHCWLFRKDLNLHCKNCSHLSLTTMK